ncbi:MAG: hypothetical protein AAGH70_00445 [Pseudomonadota bacterium]
MVESVEIARGPDVCGLDEKFTEYTRKVGELGLEYEPISVFSTDNSNATVHTILRCMGLPEERPTGGNWVDIFGNEWDVANIPSPGWGNIFDLD